MGMNNQGRKTSKIAERSASIVHFAQENGRPPTVRELAQLWGTTKVRVLAVLKRMERRTGFRLTAIQGGPNPFRSEPMG
jgi:hypothetical protein